MVSVTALSNTILSKAFSESTPVSPMKLQKLLYFIYRDYLQTYKVPLFSENFLAWRYGPVLRSAYDEFKSFGAKPITRFAKDANNNVFIIDEDSSVKLAKVINDVWNHYKHHDGISLSRLTHQNGTAWDNAVKTERPCLSDEDIMNEQIAE